MSYTLNSFEMSNDSFDLSVQLVPWDTEIFKCKVAAILNFIVKCSSPDRSDFDAFNNWVLENDISIVSCRLSQDKLAESMYLESNGFKFIEMVLHPVTSALDRFQVPTVGLLVAEADVHDIPQIGKIAEQVFGFERFHVDPRVDCKLADQRYRQWAISSFSDRNSKLVKIVTPSEEIVGFFVYEERPDNSVHWLLTAMSKNFQGRGFGFQAWLTMIWFHRKAGFQKISTTISARNIPVLNLYSKLSFKFNPPEMTFHWIRER